MLLEALVYIHDQVGIVHRDLKPENLLFMNKTEDSPLLITDFGLSKLLNSTEGVVVSSAACGTPLYLAPEMIHNNRHSYPVDMWALGVITYLLLSGYAPFCPGGENNPNFLYWCISEGKYDFDNSRWIVVSDIAKDFISNLLIINPEKRLTAKEAISHPWMKTQNNTDLLPQYKENHEKRSLKKVSTMFPVGRTTSKKQLASSIIPNSASFTHLAKLGEDLNLGSSTKNLKKSSSSIQEIANSNGSLSRNPSLVNDGMSGECADNMKYGVKMKASGVNSQGGILLSVSVLTESHAKSGPPPEMGDHCPSETGSKERQLPPDYSFFTSTLTKNLQDNNTVAGFESDTLIPKKPN